jgi:hypothetical protein
MFTHLWNLLNLTQNLYHKSLMSFGMVDAFKILKENLEISYEWKPK